MKKIGIIMALLFIVSLFSVSVFADETTTPSVANSGGGSSSGYRTCDLQDAIFSGQTEVYLYNGIEYVIENLDISESERVDIDDDSLNADLLVNGEFVSIGYLQGYVLLDGVEVEIGNVGYDNGNVYVSVYISNENTSDNNKMYEGNTDLFDIGTGNNYVVQILDIDVDIVIEAIVSTRLSVNGEATNYINVGHSQILNSGDTIIVDDIYYSGDRYYTEFCYEINEIQIDCADESYNYCSGNEACTQTTYYDWDAQSNSCVSVGGSSSCIYCESGCDNGLCKSTQEPWVRNYQFYEGWNLFPIGEGIDFDTTNADDGDFEDIMEAAYVWDPHTEEYYDLFTSEGDDILENIVDDMGYTSVWVYFNKDIELELEMDVERVQDRLEDGLDAFEEGWNYYVILPQMQEGYNDGHLNFYSDFNDQEYLRDGKIFAWDRNEWESAHYTEITEEDDDMDDYFGMPLLLNYVDDFAPYLEISEDPGVPEFPYN